MPDLYFLIPLPQRLGHRQSAGKTAPVVLREDSILTDSGQQNERKFDS